VIADLLSLSRVGMAVPLWWAMLGESVLAAWLAAILVGLAIASDLLDGSLARRLGTVSGRGRVLDHTSDFLFVTTGLAAAAARGALTPLLPGLIVLAFAQYAFDSWLGHREGGLVMSRLGRWNGILYFVPLVGDIVVRLMLPAAAGLVRAIAWMLVATTLVSMLDRLQRLVRLRRRAPGSPSAGTADRSPR
jgi:phosphatidylglycerophosphate synthase